MWQDKDPEQLARTADFINEQLARTQINEARRAQFERVLGALQTHLTEIGYYPVVDQDSTEEAVEAPQEDVTQQAATTEGVTIHLEPELELDVPKEEPEVVADEPTVVEPQRTDTHAEVTEVPGQVAPIVARPRQTSNRVESGSVFAGTDGRKSRRSRTFSSKEIGWLQQLGYKRGSENEYLGQPVLLRFDPALGLYDRSGRMYADATESRLIRDNIGVITEVVAYLADLSQQFDEGSYFKRRTMRDTLAELGHDKLEPLAERAIIREIQRMLNNTRAINIHKARDNEHHVTLHNPFVFVVTELTPARSKKPALVPESDELACAVTLWKDAFSDEAAILDALLSRTVPKPLTHQQAEKLLSVVMSGPEFYDAMQAMHPNSVIQPMIDIAHCFCLETLGWNAYNEARKARTMRSGRPGLTTVVRQVTGTQQSERFERRSRTNT